MEQKEINYEREIAEVQGDVRMHRGLNWAYSSFALIILIIILVGLLFTFLPVDVFNFNNDNTTAPGSPQSGR